MPTLLNQDGFRFFFYANDHSPAHVHVEKGDDYAKIEILTLEVVDSCFKKNDLKKALEIVEANQEEFERSWNAFFNQG